MVYGPRRKGAGGEGVAIGDPEGEGVEDLENRFVRPDKPDIISLLTVRMSIYEGLYTVAFATDVADLAISVYNCANCLSGEFQLQWRLQTPESGNGDEDERKRYLI